jgi:hypothetical protein
MSSRVSSSGRKPASVAVTLTGMALAALDDEIGIEDAAVAGAQGAAPRELAE